MGYCNAWVGAPNHYRILSKLWDSMTAKLPSIFHIGQNFHLACVNLYLTWLLFRHEFRKNDNVQCKHKGERSIVKIRVSIRFFQSERSGVLSLFWIIMVTKFRDCLQILRCMLSKFKQFNFYSPWNQQKSHKFPNDF